MKADITMKQMYYNAGILNFFFRSQSHNAFNEIFDSVEESNEAIFEAMENYTEDLDDLEEMLYNGTLGEIVETLGLTLIQNEDEDEDEDE